METGFFFCVHRHTAQHHFLYNFFVCNLPILVVEGKLKLPLPFPCLYDFCFPGVFGAVGARWSREGKVLVWASLWYFTERQRDKETRDRV